MNRGGMLGNWLKDVHLLIVLSSARWPAWGARWEIILTENWYFYLVRSSIDDVDNCPQDFKILSSLDIGTWSPELLGCEVRWLILLPKHDLRWEFRVKNFLLSFMSINPSTLFNLQSGSEWWTGQLVALCYWHGQTICSEKEGSVVNLDHKDFNFVVVSFYDLYIYEILALACHSTMVQVGLHHTPWSHSFGYHYDGVGAA